jgi:hypothetical protein
MFAAFLLNCGDTTPSVDLGVSESRDRPVMSARAGLHQHGTVRDLYPIFVRELHRKERAA